MWNEGGKIDFMLAGKDLLQRVLGLRKAVNNRTTIHRSAQLRNKLAFAEALAGWR